jgi:hypothetical protein
MRMVADPNSGFGPIGSTGFNGTPNFDGFLRVIGQDHAGGPCCSLTQVFRNGRLEAGQGPMIVTPRDTPLLSYPDSVKDLIETLPRYAKALNRAGVSPPYFIMVALLDVKGSVMIDSNRAFFRMIPLDHEDLIFDPIIINDVSFGDDWPKILMPMLDAWWNGFGWPRCVHLFNDNGDWTGFPRNW